MKSINTISIFLFSTLLLLFASCGSEHNHEEGINEQHEAEEHHEVVQLSSEELNEFGLELATAGPGKLKTHTSLSGEIIIPPDNLAHIHPRFPGMVKKVFKHIGDPVKKGQPLAVIEGNESLTEYTVSSLIDGTIIEKHLSLGEVVGDDEHGFVVADLNHVWAMLQLYQKDLPFVKVGQDVVLTSGTGQAQVKATISYISPLIDETTRTAEVRIALNNPHGIWKPGLFVNGEITTSHIKVDLLVPKTALEFYEGKRVVFVQTNEGIAPRDVQIGRSNGVAMELISGLETGETYVSKGGFTIKAELQKGEFGDGHAH